MKIACIFSLFFLFSISVTAQNTKGDKPVSNQRQVRESKGKAKAQKGNRKPKTKDLAGRRLRTKDKSSANRANVGLPQPNPYQGRKKTVSDRAAKPRGRIFSESPREQNQRAWSGDISGKPIRRIKPSKSGVARNNVYPQRGPYVNNGSKKPKKDKPKVYTRTSTGEFPKNSVPENKQRAWKGNIRGGAIGAPSRTGQTKNTYKQFGAFGTHPSRKPRTSDKIRFGDRSSVPSFAPSSSPWSRNKNYGTAPSASRSFLSRGKRNVYWGKYSRSGKAVTTDLTGRPLRTRNYRSSPAGLIGRDTLKGFGRRPGGDRASKQTGGGFLSTRKGQRAWTGDISGKNLRRTEPKTKQTAGQYFFRRKLSMSKTGVVGRPVQGTGISARKRKSGKVETSSLPVRPPGIGGTSVGKYQGSLTGRKTFKGGGSASGKSWNNNGEPVDVNRAGTGTIRASKFQGSFKRGELGPGFSRQGEGYAGNIKSRRPAKGGGSISGKTWNNNGEPVDVNRAESGTIRASKFQGNIKGGKPLKGGGSISGKLWNNNGEPIDVNQAGDGTIRASKFQGNIKGGKPLKGGGSISGKLWNNNGEPIDVNQAGDGTIRASKFQGNIKTGKPLKGGGSISGKLWNNNEEPIDVNEAGSGTIKASKFQGKIKEGSLFKRGYTQNPNAAFESIKKLRPDETTYKVDGLQIKVKQRSYKDKPVAAEGSLPGIAPKQSSVKASEYARGVKIYWNKKHNPNSADLALDGRVPTRAAERAGVFSGRTKQSKDFRHNPNSAEDALKVFYPAKALARLGDYQGNLKMHKYNDSRLHPDSKFAHGFRDNVKEERTLMMNMKLFWAKLFKKNDTQPENLKEKVRKPRYDKGELGMWND